jgi:RNA polymerase sigma-70 factor, ECF subfamily
MLNDRMICEDIVQNVFLKFFRNMDRIRNSGRIEVWLFSTARNEIFTIYRERNSHVDQFNAADADEIEIDSLLHPGEEIELKEMYELIMKELDKMASGQSEVFLLKEYGGLSYKEIADVMGIDESLVKSRLHKTRARLIEKISRIVK